MGSPNFDANPATPGTTYDAEWVTVDNPNPTTDTMRSQAQAKGAAIFDRTEGIWEAAGSVFFDCTSGGEAQLGQIWQFIPRKDGGRLKLKSTSGRRP